MDRRMKREEIILRLGEAASYAENNKYRKSANLFRNAIKEFIEDDKLIRESQECISLAMEVIAMLAERCGIKEVLDELDNADAEEDKNFLQKVMEKELKKRGK